jgi:hypothetical protein
VSVLRPRVLVIAAVVGLPAPAAAQSSLFAECPEIGGLGLFLKNQSVQTALKLTPRQVMKTIGDAQLKALARVLKPSRIKRLKELGFQVAVFEALNHPEVQKKLKLTKDQIIGLGVFK